MLCPNCGAQAPLKHYTDQEEQAGVHSCDLCSGLWFDGHTLHDFMHSRRLQARFLPSDASEPLESVGYTLETHPRRCPRCKTALEEVVYGGIEVDVCRTCRGMWFDDGELRRAIEIHAKHRAQLDVLDEELATPKHGPWDVAEMPYARQASEDGRHLGQRIKAEAQHLFEAVAHLLHHDHDT